MEAFVIKIRFEPSGQLLVDVSFQVDVADGEYATVTVYVDSADRLLSQIKSEAIANARAFIART